MRQGYTRAAPKTQAGDAVEATAHRIRCRGSSLSCFGVDVPLCYVHGQHQIVPYCQLHLRCFRGDEERRTITQNDSVVTFVKSSSLD